jgi:hypothetical protein
MERVDDLHWHKSSYSANGGASCVEVASNLPGIVAVRDSKDRNGPHLTFVPEAWSTFVDDIKEGMFRLPG